MRLALACLAGLALSGCRESTAPAGPPNCPAPYVMSIEYCQFYADSVAASGH